MIFSPGAGNAPPRTPPLLATAANSLHGP